MTTGVRVTAIFSLAAPFSSSTTRTAPAPGTPSLLAVSDAIAADLEGLESSGA
jgi:hypothetical protein